MKILATKKLFYRKYAFKVCCYVRGASDIRWRGADWVISRYDGLTNEDAVRLAEKTTLGWRSSKYHTNFPDLVLFTKTVKKYIDQDDVHVRCEGSHFNLCCADQKTYDNIIKDLYPWVSEVYCPTNEEELMFLMGSNSIKVLVKELPHSKFKYKIVMRPSMAREKRIKFSAWLDRYELDEKAISRNTRQWLTGKKPYVQDPFFYVENDEMLTMINLYLGGTISRTEEFVTKNELESA